MAGSALFYLQWEAMLITYLSVRKVAIPFNDITGLLDQTNYIIGVPPGSSYQDEFAQSMDPIKMRAWKERIEPNLEIMEPSGSTPWIEHMLNLVLTNPEFAVYSSTVLFE